VIRHKGNVINQSSKVAILFPLAEAYGPGASGPTSLTRHFFPEFWRRAAMARMNLGNSSSPGGSGGGGGGSGSSGSNMPLFPGRLPSPSSLGVMPSGSGQSPPDPPRRQRSVYTSAQIAQLEAYFNINEYIDGERKRQLSLLTKIPEQQIKVWFQNRRQKKKREQEEQLQQQLAASRLTGHTIDSLRSPGSGGSGDSSSERGGLKIKMERRHEGGEDGE